jgi:hypothetical protein
MKNQLELEASSNEDAFEQLQEFKDLYLDIWWNINKELPLSSLSSRTTYLHKIKKEMETKSFINSFIKSLKEFPEESTKREAWKKSFKQIIDVYANKSNLISTNDNELLLGQGILEATMDFIKDAKAFCPSIRLEDVGQAMRNLWIMNIIQMLLGKPVKLTPSAFAYSMLYPYTDNYLDDDKISSEEKSRLSDRFEVKIKGGGIEAQSPYEVSLFKLIEKIELEFERGTYPKVYDCLLSIHRAQRKSIILQEGIKGPYEKDILVISFEKGGASVLADAYLVSGILNRQAALFFFGYGVLLQICDDLQDSEEDRRSAHMTIISQLSNKWPLDNITSGLINFTLKLIDDSGDFDCVNEKLIKQLIRKNCLNLILFTIARNKNKYTKKYYAIMKGYFPYRRSYMNRLSKNIFKKISRLDKKYGGCSLEEILIFALS